MGEGGRVQGVRFDIWVKEPCNPELSTPNFSSCSPVGGAELQGERSQGPIASEAA
jgi:hypothetical protein